MNNTIAATDEQTIMSLLGENLDGKLRDHLPCGYTENELGRANLVDALLDEQVVEISRVFDDEKDPRDWQTHPTAWPGPETAVIKWYKLANGYVVGWQFTCDGDGDFNNPNNTISTWNFITRKL